jgi:threonine aldolase
MYEKINGEINSSSVHVVDLRSDTISKPTPEMREAMANAVVGDDVFGEDPTVAELERRAAELFGEGRRRVCCHRHHGQLNCQ